MPWAKVYSISLIIVAGFWRNYHKEDWSSSSFWPLWRTCYSRTVQHGRWEAGRLPGRSGSVGFLSPSRFQVPNLGLQIILFQLFFSFSYFLLCLFGSKFAICFYLMPQYWQTIISWKILTVFSWNNCFLFSLISPILFLYLKFVLFYIYLFPNEIANRWCGLCSWFVTGEKMMFFILFFWFIWKYEPNKILPSTQRLGLSFGWFCIEISRSTLFFNVIDLYWNIDQIVISVYKL